jgi:hypothetical protein
MLPLIGYSKPICPYSQLELSMAKVELSSAIRKHRAVSSVYANSNILLSSKGKTKIVNYPMAVDLA